MLVCTPGSTPHPTVESNGRSLHRLVVFLAFPKPRKLDFCGILPERAKSDCLVLIRAYFIRQDRQITKTVKKYPPPLPQNPEHPMPQASSASHGVHEGAPPRGPPIWLSWRLASPAALSSSGLRPSLDSVRRLDPAAAPSHSPRGRLRVDPGLLVA